MKAKLAAFGWQIVEYLRRMVTPFIINLLYGMTMLAASSIQEDAIRIILVLVLLGATGFTDFIFMRGAGEIAYKMRVVGERKRANLPVSQDSRIGVYRKSKEYAAYRGFVIGLFICILPILCIVIGAAAGADVCRTILMFTAGWAYIPVFVFQIAGKSGGDLPFASMWWGLLIVAAIWAVCGIAYILGARVERNRQSELERRSETIEEQKRSREEKKR